MCEIPEFKIPSTLIIMQNITHIKFVKLFFHMCILTVYLSETYAHVVKGKPFWQTTLTL